MKCGAKGVSAFVAVAFVVALLAVAPARLSAQAFSKEISQQVMEDLKLTKEIIQVKRKAIVDMNLGLNAQEAEGFWPVYDAYRGEMSKLDDREARLIGDFAKHYVYKTLTNDQAEKMLKEFLSIQKDEIKLKQKYVKKFKKVIPPKKVLRFYQIENKLDLIVNIQLSAQIPLTH